MNRFSAALLVSASLFVLAARARAQVPDDERARGHFQAGTSYFDEGRYADAAVQFDEAYRLSQRPVLLSNAARAYERAGDLPNAIARLEAFLAIHTPEVDAVRTSTESRLGILRERQRVEAEQRAAEAASAAAVAQQEADAAAASDAARPASDGSSRGRGLRLGGFVLAGAGVSLAAVAIPFWLSARSTHDDLARVCGPGGSSCPANRDDDLARGERRLLVARVTAAASGASLAASAALLTLGFTRRQDEPAAAATVVAGRGELAVVVYGRLR